MGYPIYYVPAGDVLPVFFSTYDGGTGASITLTGLAVTDIEIYKDGGTTQRASDAGYTLLDTDGIDFDGITGIHGFSIDTGDNTDASFYTVGAWFHVVVSAVTVDAQTVNFIAAAFRIMAAESIAAKPKVDVDAWLGTAAATPTVAGVPEVDLTHVAGATTNVAALATNVDAIITDTADMQPKLGTPAGASISADIAAIEAQTDDIGAAGAGLTAVPWNAAWDAEVQSEVADALDTAIPGVPTADSVNQRIRSMDLLTEAGGTGDLAAILVDTGTTLQGEVDGIQADTEDIQARLPAALTAGGNMKSDVLALSGDTVAADNSEAFFDNTGFNASASAIGTSAAVTAISAGGIATTSFAAGAIDAAALAADAIGASELAQAAAQEIADEVLNRNLAGGGSGNTRNVRNALRILRNKASIGAGTLTVTEEDDTTAAWTAAVTTTAGDPISAIDPA